MTTNLILLTSLTMLAFAANSVFCRLALVDASNDPISFTIVRLGMGALVLSWFFFRRYSRQDGFSCKPHLWSPLALFSYAFFFSLAYVRINTGTGALILFASVQLTMIAAALLRGTKLNRKEKIGFFLAAAGFIYLLSPGLDMPPAIPAIMMIFSGISWGLYSLLGQGAKDPIYATARNFVFTIPLLIVLGLFWTFQLTPQGFLWASLSGGLTSGLGYVLWYRVLKSLNTANAAIVQLSVPALAAGMGILFLGETLSLRLVLASFLILFGIYTKVRA